MTTWLDGVIKEILYSHSDEEKLVIMVSNEHEYKVQGYFAGVFTGFKLHVEGEETQDWQGIPYLKAQKWNVLAYPTDADNVIAFFQKTSLYSKLKDYGIPKTDRTGELAKKLYDVYGANTIPQYLFNSEKMNRHAGFVKGSGWQLRFHMQAQYVLLFEQVSGALRETTPWACRYTEPLTDLIWDSRVKEELEEYTVEQFLACPYELIKIPGITDAFILNDYDFSDADAIAATRGIPKDDPTRVYYGVLYWQLKIMNDFGHVYLFRDQLIKTAAEKLQVSIALVEETVSRLIDEKIMTNYMGRQNILYLSEYYWHEYNVAKKLLELKGDQTNAVHNEVDYSLLQNQFQFNEQQLAAIQSAVDNRVTIITGGPGTGKTTVVRGIIDAMEQLGTGNIALAAPTGKASQRLKDATQHDASTIHSLLKIGPNLDYAAVEPLVGLDAIIVDETSMVSLRLMSFLLKAVVPGTHLILVGDKDQLPSIDPGLVFCNIIESGQFSTITLTQNYRQEEGGLITNAKRIIAGEYLEQTNCDDFTFYEIEDDEEIAEKTLELACDELPRALHTDAADVDAIQVLSPIKKQKIGTYELNRRIQSKVNPTGEAFFVGPDREEQRHFVIRCNDKVINLFNDNRLYVFNGSVGKAISISDSSAKLTCQFDCNTDNPKEKSYLQREYSDIRVDLAYALTVHKAQGSEYDYVVIPFSDSRNLYRNLLYTAITRAKKHVYLIGTEENLRKGIENTEPMHRNTHLKDWLYR